MQVDGVQVNPVEWWDEHWIKDRILSKLPDTRQVASRSLGQQRCAPSPPAYPD